MRPGEEAVYPGRHSQTWKLSATPPARIMMLGEDADGGGDFSASVKRA